MVALQGIVCTEEISCEFCGPLLLNGKVLACTYSAITYSEQYLNSCYRSMSIYINLWSVEIGLIQIPP